MIKNVFNVLSGSIISQIIMLATMPIISRLYSAESLGKYQIYISIISILLMIVTLRYEVALLITRSDKALFNLIKTVLLICLTTSLTTAFIIFLIAPLITLHFNSIFDILYFLPIAMFFGGIHQTFTYIPIKKRNYKLSSTSKIVQSVIYSIFSIAVFFSGLSSLGLIIADIFSRIAASLWILKYIINSFCISNRNLDFNIIKIYLYRFRKYPLMTFPGTLLSALSASLIPILLLYKFNLEIAGQYTLIERFILMPIGMISGAISQVFTGDFSEKVSKNTPDLRRNFRKTVLWLSLIALIPSIFLFLNAHWLIPFIFGDKWILAGNIGSALTFVAFINFVVTPVNMTLIILNFQKIQLLWEIFKFSLILIFSIKIYLSENLDIIQMSSYYSLLILLIYGVYIALADYMIQQKHNIKRLGEVF